MNKSQPDRTSIDCLVNLLSDRKNSGKCKIIIFVGAAVSMRAPACLPAAYPMVQATIKVLLQNNTRGEMNHTVSLPDKLKEDWLSSNDNDTKRPGWQILQPEMLYDAIYEFAGNKVFSALDCLKSNHPNVNHRILATLLEQGFVDHIITTNFDSLIEQSLAKKSLFSLSSARTRIWKIHGDILKPNTIATTIRRIGQAAFNEDLISRLKGLLEGSHVLFIGYGGADPDLMPAFMSAKMASVYWCVKNEKDIENKINKRPWQAIQENTPMPISWIVADLQKDELLVPIAKELKILPTDSQKDDKDFKEDNLSLEESMTKWEEDEKARLSPVEKALAILQILYNIALFSSEPVDAWILLIETASAMAEDPGLSNYWYSEFRRDLHVYQAEAYLKLGSFVQQLDDAMIAQVLLNPNIPDDLHEFTPELITDDEIKQNYLDVVRKLRDLPLKIDAPNAEEQVGQLFIRAKNHLKVILPLRFQDAIQVQALLNASSVLASLASGRSMENEQKNIQGAKDMLSRGLRICKRGRINIEKRNLLEARCYSNLAVLDVGEGKLKKALHQFRTAESLFKEAGDLYSYIVTCINVALLLINLKRFKEAEKYRDNAENALKSFPNENLEKKLEELKAELPLEIQTKEKEEGEK